MCCTCGCANASFNACGPEAIGGALSSQRIHWLYHARSCKKKEKKKKKKKKKKIPGVCIIKNQKKNTN
eukprot:NODE_6649_length_492_cov_178.084668.p2 GENE.NODE_6649_length_492_cov_178.084668~~NODE_6649_length_492_cov_178.084668.p2  ORF type:complete len:68 (-),score=43.36 NODE_6649_length_492_cov_178.084668:3-206(-)